MSDSDARDPTDPVDPVDPTCPIDPVALFVLIDAGEREGHLRELTLDSLRAQTRGAWQARSVSPAYIDVETPATHRATPVTASDVVEQFTAALRDTTTAYVGVLADGDRLLPDTVAALTAALDADPETDLVYGDELVGERVVRKPVWSPERLRHHNYIGRPWLARADVVRAALATVERNSSWEYDLLLRLGETNRVRRVVGTLCERGPVADRVDTADAAAAVERHLDRLAIAGTAHANGPVVRVARPLAANVSVNVVIPTGWARPADAPEQLLVLNAVRGLLAATEHTDVRVTVVYDEPVPDGALDELREIAGHRLRLVPYRKPFNFSEKCNLGAVADTADVIVLYNDDVVPASSQWLETLAAPLADPTVGVTGAKLRFPDGRIQSGGHRYYRTPETPSPVDGFRLTAADDTGEDDVLLVDREVSGVTGACLAVRRDVYDAVGGLSEHLPHNYNDVDFCLKVRRAGWRILWIADCEMTHYESQTRQARVESWEHDRLRERWGGFFADAYLP